MTRASWKSSRRTTRSVIESFVAVLFVCLAAATPLSQSPTGSNTTPEPADRLFLASFALGDEFDQLYRSETERLLALCTYYGSPCFSQHFTAKRLMVSRVHFSPEPSSRVVAYIYALLKVSGEQYGGLTAGLQVELADAPGQFHTWMESVGDWSYGIYVSGVRPRRNWVQMFGSPFPPQAWISTEVKSFEAHVRPIADEILGLESVRAVFPDGRMRLVPTGTYVIKRSSRIQVEFRAEVPSDMACDEPVAPPPVKPPTLRARPAEFFNKDGSPRFSVVYQKGC